MATDKADRIPRIPQEAAVAGARSLHSPQAWEELPEEQRQDEIADMHMALLFAFPSIREAVLVEVEALVPHELKCRCGRGDTFEWRTHLPECPRYEVGSMFAALATLKEEGGGSGAGAPSASVNTAGAHPDPAATPPGAASTSPEEGPTDGAGECERCGKPMTDGDPEGQPYFVCLNPGCPGQLAAELRTMADAASERQKAGLAEMVRRDQEGISVDPVRASVEMLVYGSLFDNLVALRKAAALLDSLPATPEVEEGADDDAASGFAQAIAAGPRAENYEGSIGAVDDRLAPEVEEGADDDAASGFAQAIAAGPRAENYEGSIGAVDDRLAPEVEEGVSGEGAALGRIRAAAQSDADLTKHPAVRDFLLRETEGARPHRPAFERLRLHARFDREQPEAGRRSINDVAQELIDAASDESRAQVEEECERFFEQDVRDRAAFLAATPEPSDTPPASVPSGGDALPADLEMWAKWIGDECAKGMEDTNRRLLCAGDLRKAAVRIRALDGGVDR